VDRCLTTAHNGAGEDEDTDEEAGSNAFGSELHAATARADPARSPVCAAEEEPVATAEGNKLRACLIPLIIANSDFYFYKTTFYKTTSIRRPCETAINSRWACRSQKRR